MQDIVNISEMQNYNIQLPQYSKKPSSIFSWSICFKLICCRRPWTTLLITALQELKRVQSVATELNWHSLVFDELTNRRVGRVHWSLVEAHALSRVRQTVPTVMHYCLRIGQFVKN